MPLKISNKSYYIPSIDEFHVGFEYEIKDWWTMRVVDAETGEADYSGFTERILTEQMLHEWRYRTREELIELQKTSDGCVGNPGADYRHEWERISTGIKDGSVRVKCLDESDIEELGFVSIGLNGWENINGNIINIHPDGNIVILKSSDGTCLFDGILKNKSELKKILTKRTIRLPNCILKKVE